MNSKLVDVFAGLDEAVLEAAKLEKAAARMVNPNDDELLDWLLVQGLASAVEKIYTHVESALFLVTKTVDGAPLEKDGGWHMNLLTRMQAPYPNVRPAVLSAEAYKLAKELCAFRHLERGIYGTDLDRGRVVQQVPMAVRLARLVREEAQALDAALHQS